MTLASDIISQVRQQLMDMGTVQRWTDTELLGWLSDAQRAVVAVYPAAAPRDASVRLQAGTQQPIDPTWHSILHITRNCDASGNPGRSVRLTTREQLDQFNPDWHIATATSVVTNVAVDKDDTVFYVYPPNDGTGYLEVVYALIPGQLALTDAIAVKDSWRAALFNYTMGMAHLKDSDFAGGAAAAKVYMDAFTALMGVTAQSLEQLDPNAQKPPSGSS